MRPLIIATVLLACAAPVAAQPFSAADADSDLASALPHPFDVEMAGERLDRAVGAILEMPVGGVVEALDPEAPVDRDSSVADVAGRGDPAFADRVHDQVGRMTMRGADLMRQLAVIAPVISRSLADLESNLARALDEPYAGE